MASNPKSDKLDPLNMKKIKHGIKVDRKGNIVIPEDLYEKFRPESFEKGIERKVASFQAKFAASVLASASDEVVDHFKKNKECESINGKTVLGYRGNNLNIRIARNKKFPMDGVQDKKAFATLGITHSFKSAVKPIREHLADLAKKRKI